jgi:hypothetical protein
MRIGTVEQFITQNIQQQIALKVDMKRLRAKAKATRSILV